MTDRPVPTEPPDPQSPDLSPDPASPDPGSRGAIPPRWYGWRVEGRRIERTLELEDTETGELFLDLLERLVRLTGVRSEIRLRSGEVRIRGERSVGERVGPLSVSLRLELDHEPLDDP